MSQGLEVTDPVAYRRQLDEQLAGRDPLDVLELTATRLRALFAGEPDETIRARPYPGKWTPLEVLGHLVDAEWSFGWRMRSVLGDDTPPIEPMDQEKWAIAQGHNGANLDALLDDFETLRSINLRLWRRMTPTQLTRVGVHRQRGEESLDTMRRMLAGHDESHLDQIERYLSAANAPAAPEQVSE